MYGPINLAQNSRVNIGSHYNSLLKLFILMYNGDIGGTYIDGRQDPGEFTTLLCRMCDSMIWSGHVEMSYINNLADNQH